jgi:hypothetical protein
VQVLFADHEDMAQALPPGAAEKSLAHGVRARRSDRGLEHPRTDPLSGAVEVLTELVPRSRMMNRGPIPTASRCASAGLPTNHSARG